jgi:hypothetical protein
MGCKRSMVDPGRADGDAELDALLAATDDGMLTAIMESLDLDTGLARIPGSLAQSTTHAAGQGAAGSRERKLEAVPSPGNASPGNSHRRGLRVHGCSFRGLQRAADPQRSRLQVHQRKHWLSRNRVRMGCRTRLCCNRMSAAAGESRTAIRRLSAGGLRHEDLFPLSRSYVQHCDAYAVYSKIFMQPESRQVGTSSSCLRRRAVPTRAVYDAAGV